MCGIFGYIGKGKNVPQLVLAGLKSLEYRGYDSWGIASLDKQGRIRIKKKTGKIGENNVETLPDNGMALGHTRWATHGGVTVANAHPHLDCSGKITVIHNGIIENYLELKKPLIKKGHIFRSETDTEVAVHLIEDILADHKKNSVKTVKEDFAESVRLAFKKMSGLNAIIVMEAGSQVFVAAKNGSPLTIGRGTVQNEENLLASDAHAILPFTRDLYFMEDDEVVTVGRKEITVRKLADGTKKQIKFQQVNWQIREEVKGKFTHFMLKEIYDQIKVLQSVASADKVELSKLAALIAKSYGTYMIGCGTAAYACLAGTYIFSKIAKKHVNFSIASEFGYLLDFLTKQSLVIGLSQSGETIDLLDSLKKAKEKGATIVALVNVLGSSLYRLSDHKLLLQAGSEKAVVSTKAFTAKLAYLMMLAYILAGKAELGKNYLLKAVQAVEAILKSDFQQKIINLAQKLASRQHIYLIGRGISYPIALESALKIKEASYIHAEGFAGGELKHGVIALIEKNTPCIGFLPNDESYNDTLSGLMEMKSRGGMIIGVSFRHHEIFDEYLPVSDCGIASAIPNAVAGQLLGYYLAVQKGIDPDKPRNLAKSVTVK